MSWPVRKVIRAKWGVPIRPCADQLADPAQRRLEAEVLVHHQRHAGVRASRDHRLAVGQGRGERLLDDGRDLHAGRELDQRPMRGHRGRDVDEVGLGLAQHGGGVGVGAPGSETLGRALGLGRIEVAHRHQLDVGDRGPRVEMVLGEEAAADDGAAQALAHVSSTRILRISRRSRMPVRIESTSTAMKMITLTISG